MTDSRQDKSLLEPVLDSERQQKASEYARIGRYMSLTEIIIVGVPLLLLVFGGFSEKFIGYINLPVIPAAIMYFLILIIAYWLLTAPVNYYQGHVLPRRYGLSKQSLTAWLSDQIKRAFISLPLGIAIVAALYWFIDISPQNWWLLIWALVLLVSLILSILLPVILLPLFFRTKPIEDKPLNDRFKQLAVKADANITGIYTVEFSAKGTTANAALMGLGKTKRITLSDTLLQDYSVDEIEIIIAHELGHYKNRDFVRIFILQAIIMLLYLWLTFVISNEVAGPLGLGEASSIAALPLLVLLFSIINMVFMPLSNIIIRYFEKAADSFAMKITCNQQAFISVMTRITEQNLAEARPSRWIELLFYDHPSYHNRLKHARRYFEFKRSDG